jgi:hypothetical protein
VFSGASGSINAACATFCGPPGGEASCTTTLRYVLPTTSFDFATCFLGFDMWSEANVYWTCEANVLCTCTPMYR